MLRVNAAAIPEDWKPYKLVVKERLSFPFSMTVFFHGFTHPEKKMLGRDCSVRIALKNQGHRYWQGMIVGFEEQEGDSTLRSFKLHVSAALSLLSLHHDFRIFRRLSVVGVAYKIFDEHHLARPEIKKLSCQGSVHDFIVQYDESSLHFLNRIMGDVEIGYYFRCDDRSCVMHWFDDVKRLPDCLSEDQVGYVMNGLEAHYLASNKPSSFYAESDLSCVQPAVRFCREGVDYYVHAVRHVFQQPSAYWGVKAPQKKVVRYSNTFCCATVFRAQKYAVRVARGYQTAKVVVSHGGVSDTSDYPQLRVQFHWNHRHSTVSKWIDMAQVVCGEGWGWQCLPRKNDEVITVFQEGNPEKPVLIGCLYNSSCVPPFSFPKKKYYSGFLTQTLSGGQHELIFNDTPSAEVLTIQSAGGLNVHVAGSIEKKVGGDDRTEIENKMCVVAKKGCLAIRSENIVFSVGNSSIRLQDSLVQLFSGDFQMHCSGVRGVRHPALRGHQHACPQTSNHLPHVGGGITTASTDVLVNGVGIARVGDALHCNGPSDVIAAGIEGLLVNDRAMASCGDLTQHGGRITVGTQCMHVEGIGSAIFG